MKKFRTIKVAAAGLIVAAFLFSFPLRSQSPAADLALPGPRECHTQGITVSGDYLFISCVERLAKRGMIYRYALPDGFPASPTPLSEPESHEITTKAMYHPSGLDRDGKCVWAAAAHYRSFMARSRVMCLDPKSFEAVKSFEINDHIGAVAVMGDTLVGFNWDSKDIYRFTRDGKLLGKDLSPGSVAFQDCQGAGPDEVRCSGPGKDGAVVELLRYHAGTDPAWTVESSARLSNPDINLGREGFAVMGDYWLFAPADYPRARLLAYPMPRE